MALLAQEVVRVVDEARRLVRLHVVAVDDPLQGAAARNRIALRLRRNARQGHVVVVLQAREVLIAAPQLREAHLSLADPVALPRVRGRVQARLLLHRRVRLHLLVVHVQVRQLVAHARIRVETRRARNMRQHLLQVILIALPILRVMQKCTKTYYKIVSTVRLVARRATLPSGNR